MSHWFHRNPLKATAPQPFHLTLFGHEVDAIRILSDLKQSRQALLDLLPDPHHEVNKVEAALNAYQALLRGFLVESGDSGEEKPSRLRHCLTFRWSHSVLSAAPNSSTTGDTCQDAVFEAANLMINVALWYMKHAAMVAAKEGIQMDEAKHVHTSLRQAAGLFKFVQDTLAPQLAANPKLAGSDLDVRVMSAYLNQCTGEAQEVTMARAVELKHNADLISSLAYETSKMFTTAADSLATLDDKVFGHWRHYFLLKAKFYEAYAYNYKAEALLSVDKCGDAIRSLQEADKAFNLAAAAAKDYAKIKGPGTTAKPEQHAFFKKLQPIIKRTMDKCQRENGLIYHQKVPFDAPDLTINSNTFGLVSPEPYQLSALSPQWTSMVLASIDTTSSSNDAKGKGKAKKPEPELKPVKEVSITHSDKEPKNESGCVVC